MMKHVVVIVLLASTFLYSCAGPRTSATATDTFEKADANRDAFIDYAEFKNYMTYKAAPHPDERAIVKEEARNGYLAHQKRFLALDVNNDGKLSSHELGGG